MLPGSDWLFPRKGARWSRQVRWVSSDIHFNLVHLRKLRESETLIEIYNLTLSKSHIYCVTSSFHILRNICNITSSLRIVYSYSYFGSILKILNSSLFYDSRLVATRNVTSKRDIFHDKTFILGAYILLLRYVTLKRAFPWTCFEALLKLKSYIH